jgi:hypothetical protein
MGTTLLEYESPTQLPFCFMQPLTEAGYSINSNSFWVDDKGKICDIDSKVQCYEDIFKKPSSWTYGSSSYIKFMDSKIGVSCNFTVNTKGVLCTFFANDQYVTNTLLACGLKALPFSDEFFLRGNHFCGKYKIYQLDEYKLNELRNAINSCGIKHKDIEECRLHNHGKFLNWKLTLGLRSLNLMSGRAIVSSTRQSIFWVALDNKKSLPWSKLPRELEQLVSHILISMGAVLIAPGSIGNCDIKSWIDITSDLASSLVCEK